MDDRLVEGDETAALTVATGTGYDPTGSPASGTFTDNDTATLGFTVGTGTALESVGTQMREQSAAEFEAYMKAEVAKYAKLIKDTGVRIE